MQLKRVGNCIIFKRPLSYFDRATSGQTKKRNEERQKRTKKNKRKAERSNLKGKKKRN